MNNDLIGHWYCAACNDTVTLPKPRGRWDARSGVKCPVCHNNSANWVSHSKEHASRFGCPDGDAAAAKAVTGERAQIGFAEIRKAIK